MHVRRRGIGSIAIVVGIGWLAACSSDDSTTGPTRLRTDVVSRTVTFPTSPCRVSGDDVIQNGYGGGLDPVQRSICGVPISLRAVPDTGADTWVVWWYEFDVLQPPQQWLMSGGTGAGGSPFTGTGDVPLIIDFGTPVTSAEVRWQFTPKPGSVVQAFDANDILLAQEFYGSNTVQSVGASWPPGYTEETHTFPQPGIRRLKITAPPGPPLVNSTSKMFVEVYFAPDTTCPPTGDVFLNAPSILAEFKRALDSTMMDAGRKERGGVLFRDDNSQPPSFQVLPLTAADFPGYLSTDCEFAVGLVSQSRFTQLATYHTHGRAAGRANPILQCAARQGYTAALGPSQCSVGQSCDFKVADALQQPVYAIDQDFVFRIQPNMHGAQTRDSEARWLWKSLNGKACLEPG